AALPGRTETLRSAILAAVLQCSVADLNARATPAQRVDIETAVERLLLAYLDDGTAATLKVAPPVGEGRYDSQTRVKDYAACALARLWPDRFTFAAAGAVAARDRQIAAMPAALQAALRARQH